MTDTAGLWRQDVTLLLAGCHSVSDRMDAQVASSRFASDNFIQFKNFSVTLKVERIPFSDAEKLAAMQGRTPMESASLTESMLAPRNRKFQE